MGEVVEGFRVGDRVDGLYDENSDEMWYPGRVRRVHVSEAGAGTVYEVFYDDGEVESHVKPEFLRRHVRGTISAGTRVLSRYDGSDDYYPGQVSDVQDDGRFTIAYDDGEVEEDVPMEFLHEPEEDGAGGDEGVEEDAPTPAFEVTTDEGDGQEADPEAQADSPNSDVNARAPKENLGEETVERTEDSTIQDDSPSATDELKGTDEAKKDEPQPSTRSHEEERSESTTGEETTGECKDILDSLQMLEKRMEDAASTKSVLSTLVKQMRAYPQVTADVVHEHDGERLVVEALKFHQSHAVIQCYGFVLLRRLCFLCVKSTHFLLRNGIIELVTQAMNTFAEDAILQASACGALAVFTRVHAGLSLLLEYHVAQLVLATLVYHKTYSVHTRQVHYYACEVLLELCELGDTRTLGLLCGEQDEEYGSEMSPISLLLFLLRQGLSLDDKKACCAVGSLLMCLAASGRLAASLIIDLNGLSELSTVMARYPTEPSIQKYSGGASKQIALCSVHHSPTKRVKETATQILRETESWENLHQDRKVDTVRSAQTRPTPTRKTRSGFTASYGTPSNPRGSAYGQRSTTKHSQTFSKINSPVGNAPHLPSNMSSFGGNAAAREVLMPGASYRHQQRPQQSNLVILDGADNTFNSAQKRRQIAKEERQSALLDSYGVHTVAGRHGIKRTQLKTQFVSAESPWATAEQQLAREEMLAGSNASKPYSSPPEHHNDESVYAQRHPTSSRQNRWEASDYDRYHNLAVYNSGSHVQQQAAKKRKKKPLGTRSAFQVRIENETQLRVSKEMRSPFASPQRLGGATKKAARARQKRLAAGGSRSSPTDRSNNAANISSESLNAYATELFHDGTTGAESTSLRSGRMTPREKADLRERERLSFAEKLHKMIDKAKSTLANSATTSVASPEETSRSTRSVSSVKSLSRTAQTGKPREPPATRSDDGKRPLAGKKPRVMPSSAPKRTTKEASAVITAEEREEAKKMKPSTAVSKRQGESTHAGVAKPKAKASSTRTAPVPKATASVKPSAESSATKALIDTAKQEPAASKVTSKDNDTAAAVTLITPATTLETDDAVQRQVEAISSVVTASSLATKVQIGEAGSGPSSVAPVEGTLTQVETAIPPPEADTERSNAPEYLVPGDNTAAEVPKSTNTTVSDEPNDTASSAAAPAVEVVETSASEIELPAKQVSTEDFPAATSSPDEPVEVETDPVDTGAEPSRQEGVEAVEASGGVEKAVDKQVTREASAVDAMYADEENEFDEDSGDDELAVADPAVELDSMKSPVVGSLDAANDMLMQPNKSGEELYADDDEGDDFEDDELPKTEEVSTGNDAGEALVEAIVSGNQNEETVDAKVGDADAEIKDVNSKEGGQRDSNSVAHLDDDTSPGSRESGGEAPEASGPEVAETAVADLTKSVEPDAARSADPEVIESAEPEVVENTELAEDENEINDGGKVLATETGEGFAQPGEAHPPATNLAKGVDADEGEQKEDSGGNCASESSDEHAAERAVKDLTKADVGDDDEPQENTVPDICSGDNVELDVDPDKEENESHAISRSVGYEVSDFYNYDNFDEETMNEIAEVETWTECEASAINATAEPPQQQQGNPTNATAADSREVSSLDMVAVATTEGGDDEEEVLIDRLRSTVYSGRCGKDDPGQDAAKQDAEDGTSEQQSGDGATIANASNSDVLANIAISADDSSTALEKGEYSPKLTTDRSDFSARSGAYGDDFNDDANEDADEALVNPSAPDARDGNNDNERMEKEMAKSNDNAGLQETNELPGTAPLPNENLVAATSDGNSGDSVAADCSQETERSADYGDGNLDEEKAAEDAGAAPTAEETDETSDPPQRGENDGVSSSDASLNAEPAAVTTDSSPEAEAGGVEGDNLTSSRSDFSPDSAAYGDDDFDDDQQGSVGSADDEAGGAVATEEGDRSVEPTPAEPSTSEKEDTENEIPVEAHQIVSTADAESITPETETKVESAPSGRSDASENSAAYGDGDFDGDEKDNEVDPSASAEDEGPDTEGGDETSKTGTYPPAVEAQSTGDPLRANAPSEPLDTDPVDLPVIENTISDEAEPGTAFPTEEPITNEGHRDKNMDETDSALNSVAPKGGDKAPPGSSAAELPPSVITADEDTEEGDYDDDFGDADFVDTGGDEEAMKDAPCEDEPTHTGAASGKADDNREVAQRTEGSDNADETPVAEETNKQIGPQVTIKSNEYEYEQEPAGTPPDPPEGSREGGAPTNVNQSEDEVESSTPVIEDRVDSVVGDNLDTIEAGEVEAFGDSEEALAPGEGSVIDDSEGLEQAEATSESCELPLATEDGGSNNTQISSNEPSQSTIFSANDLVGTPATEQDNETDATMSLVDTQHDVPLELVEKVDGDDYAFESVSKSADHNSDPIDGSPTGQGIGLESNLAAGESEIERADALADNSGYSSGQHVKLVSSAFDDQGDEENLELVLADSEEISGSTTHESAAPSDAQIAAAGSSFDPEKTQCEGDHAADDEPNDVDSATSGVKSKLSAAIAQPTHEEEREATDVVTERITAHNGEGGEREDSAEADTLTKEAEQTRYDSNVTEDGENDDLKVVMETAASTEAAPDAVESVSVTDPVTTPPPDPEITSKANAGAGPSVSQEVAPAFVEEPPTAEDNVFYVLPTNEANNAEAAAEVDPGQDETGSGDDYAVDEFDEAGGDEVGVEEVPVEGETTEQVALEDTTVEEHAVENSGDVGAANETSPETNDVPGTIKPTVFVSSDGSLDDVTTPNNSEDADRQNTGDSSADAVASSLTETENEHNSERMAIESPFEERVVLEPSVDPRKGGEQNYPAELNESDAVTDVHSEEIPESAETAKGAAEMVEAEPTPGAAANPPVSAFVGQDDDSDANGGADQVEAPVEDNLSGEKLSAGSSFAAASSNISDQPVAVDEAAKIESDEQQTTEVSAELEPPNIVVEPLQNAGDSPPSATSGDNEESKSEENEYDDEDEYNEFEDNAEDTEEPAPVARSPAVVNVAAADSPASNTEDDYEDFENEDEKEQKPIAPQPKLAVVDAPLATVQVAPDDEGGPSSGEPSPLSQDGEYSDDQDDEYEEEDVPTPSPKASPRPSKPEKQEISASTVTAVTSEPELDDYVDEEDFDDDDDEPKRSAGEAKAPTPATAFKDTPAVGSDLEEEEYEAEYDEFED